MNRISFLNRGYAFKGLLAVPKKYKIVLPRCFKDCIKIQLYRIGAGYAL